MHLSRDHFFPELRFLSRICGGTRCLNERSIISHDPPQLYMRLLKPRFTEITNFTLLAVSFPCSYTAKALHPGANKALWTRAKTPHLGGGPIHLRVLHLLSLLLSRNVSRFSRTVARVRTAASHSGLSPSPLPFCSPLFVRPGARVPSLSRARAMTFSPAVGDTLKLTSDRGPTRSLHFLLRTPARNAVG